MVMKLVLICADCDAKTGDSRRQEEQSEGKVIDHGEEILVAVASLEMNLMNDRARTCIIISCLPIISPGC